MQRGKTIGQRVVQLCKQGRDLFHRQEEPEQVCWNGRKSKCRQQVSARSFFASTATTMALAAAMIEDESV